MNEKRCPLFSSVGFAIAACCKILGTMGVIGMERKEDFKKLMESLVDIACEKDSCQWYENICKVQYHIESEGNK